MTDELVKNLRFNAKQVQQYNLMILLFKAADAIEKLNRKVEDFESMREISPEAEYAINKHADNIISRLDKLINDSKDNPHWIPVTERLPEEKQASYWCFTDDGYYCEVRWTNSINGFTESDKWGWNIFDIPQYNRVTHWMSLPDPPKKEAE